MAAEMTWRNDQIGKYAKQGELTHTNTMIYAIIGGKPLNFDRYAHSTSMGI